jgi:hypothetical protein
MLHETGYHTDSGAVLLFNSHHVSVKVKVNFSLCLTMYYDMKMYLLLNKHHAMKTYWVGRGIASCILKFSTRWTCVASFTLFQLLNPWGKKPQYQIDMWSASHSSHLIAGEKAPVPNVEEGCWVQEASLDMVAKRENHHHCPCWELNLSFSL